MPGAVDRWPQGITDYGRERYAYQKPKNPAPKVTENAGAVEEEVRADVAVIVEGAKKEA
jgi:hypothetical protein